MKKSSFGQTALLCLPVLFVVVIGALISGVRERERKERIAYYSQPYKPQLKVERAEVPKIAGLFEARAHCVSTGGSRQSDWWVRGQLFDVSGKTPIEIWNSQKAPKSVSHILTWPGPIAAGGVDEEADFSWRFSRDTKDKRTLKFVVEAVAIPIAVPQNKLGSHNISVKEAKPFQITWAKQQPNAKYFREFIELKPSDDSKYQTQ